MELTHTVYEPRGKGPHPTLLALHGWGTNVFDLLALAPQLAGGRFRVVCPQGPIDVPMPGVKGHGWFPLTSSTQAAAARPFEDVAAALGRFLERARARYALDAAALVILGFSQGGVLAYRLALASPHTFAALIVLSSWLPPALGGAFTRSPALQVLPTLVQHGSNDEIIAVQRARTTVETLRELRLPLTYREYPIGHEISPASLHELSTWLEEHVLHRPRPGAG